jgi:hypothetical protein
MTLDRDDIQAIAEAVVALLAGKPVVVPDPPPVPGSFVARRQASLDELARKQAKRKAV